MCYVKKVLLIILKNTYFEEHLQTTAFKYLNFKY